MEIREMLRQLRAGESERSVSRNLGVHRKTVKRYHLWAQTQGLLSGELPEMEVLNRLLETTFSEVLPPQNTSSVEAYRETVVKLVSDNVRISAIHARLQERGYRGSYSAVRRFVRQLRGSVVEVTVRVERAPGEEAQVDFGYAGYMLDSQGDRRKAWVFVMTLSWSRHMYVEFVFDQRVETWLQVHRNAFTFFGGVPQRIVPDNLKAAVVRAAWGEGDEQVQWAYRECAEHYGFIIAPCRPRTPQHKGKVERSVAYVKGNFLGGREEMWLTDANVKALDWCEATAGQRVHGTTKQQPLARFTQTERACLNPLPVQPYDLVSWKRARLYRDCHVVYDQAFYSAPFRLVGQHLLVRGGTRTVKLYTEHYDLVATHTRAAQPGQRVTLVDHLPPYKVEGLLWTAEMALGRAERLGPAVLQTVQHLLTDTVVDPLPKTRRLLALAKHYTPQQLNAACERALAHGDPAYVTVKRILKRGLHHQRSTPPVYLPSSATTFARRADELLGAALQEVTSW